MENQVITRPDRLTEDEQADLLARLREYEIPVNAFARVLDISGTAFQRYLSGKYAMPRTLADLLKAYMAFRDGSNRA